MSEISHKIFDMRGGLNWGNTCQNSLETINIKNKKMEKKQLQRQLENSLKINKSCEHNKVLSLVRLLLDLLFDTET